MLLFLFLAVTVDRTVTGVRYNSSNDSSVTAIIQIRLCFKKTKHDKWQTHSYILYLQCGLHYSEICALMCVTWPFENQFHSIISL